VNSRFIDYAFKSPEVRKQIDNGSGSTVGTYTIIRAKNTQISLPPLPEQGRIVEKLDALMERIDKNIQLVESNLEQAKMLQKSVLNQFFGVPNEGWQKCKLKEKVILNNGRAYKKDELLQEGKYQVIRIQNLKGGENWYYSDLELDPNKYCENGDLLFSWSGTPGTSFGAFFWNGNRAIYHYHIWRVDIGDDLDREFAYFLLQHLTNIAIATSHGVTGMMHVTKEKMEKFEIFIPELSEQIEIGQTLKTIQRKGSILCDHYKQRLNELRALKSSILDSTFRGELTKSKK